MLGRHVCVTQQHPPLPLSAALLPTATLGTGYLCAPLSQVLLSVRRGQPGNRGFSAQQLVLAKYQCQTAVHHAAMLVLAVHDLAHRNLLHRSRPRKHSRSCSASCSRLLTTERGFTGLVKASSLMEIPPKCCFRIAGCAGRRSPSQPRRLSRDSRPSKHLFLSQGIADQLWHNLHWMSPPQCTAHTSRQEGDCSHSAKSHLLLAAHDLAHWYLLQCSRPQTVALPQRELQAVVYN